MAFMGRPRQMFGKTGRIEPVAEVFQAGKMVWIKAGFAADRQADTVDRDRKPLGQDTQLRNRATAVTHVILGMHFKPPNRVGIVQNVGEMLCLVADAGQGGQLRESGRCIGHGRPLWWQAGRTPGLRNWQGLAGYVPAWPNNQPCGRSRSSSSSEPMRAEPSAIAGSSISAQVPASTSVQALPW